VQKRDAGKTGGAALGTWSWSDACLHLTSCLRCRLRGVFLRKVGCCGDVVGVVCISERVIRILVMFFCTVSLSHAFEIVRLCLAAGKGVLP
jgi:hypothetical protein